MSEVNLDPVSVVNAEFSSTYVRADENVELKVMHWQPLKPESEDPIIFVAGWVSSVSGWTDVIQALASKQPVFYIESREKQSAKITLKNPKPQNFSIKQMSKDLIHICRKLPVNMDRAILMGSSLGATSLLEALKYGAMPAKAAFLIGPNSEFKAPPILKHIIHFHHSSYHILIYIAIWYLRLFRVDAKKEPEQMRRYDETLRTAHTQRLKLSAKAAISMKYQLWPDIETIQVPVALAFAPTDTLHDAKNIQQMVDKLPKGVANPCPSNRYMHSANIINDLYCFLNNIEN